MVEAQTGPTRFAASEFEKSVPVNDLEISSSEETESDSDSTSSADQDLQPGSTKPHKEHRAHKEQDKESTLDESSPRERLSLRPSSKQRAFLKLRSQSEPCFEGTKEGQSSGQSNGQSSGSTGSADDAAIGGHGSGDENKTRAVRSQSVIGPSPQGGSPSNRSRSASSASLSSKLPLTKQVQSFTIKQITTKQAAPKMFRPMGDCPKHLTVTASQLTISKNSFKYLHDHVALPWLIRDQKAVEAFHAFRLANELHTQLTGKASGSSMYNMACCLCMVARTRDNRNGYRMIPRVTEQFTVDTALDAAAKWLQMSIIAGGVFAQPAHIKNDEVLAVLAEKRPVQFELALMMAKAMYGSLTRDHLDQERRSRSY